MPGLVPPALIPQCQPSEPTGSDQEGQHSACGWGEQGAYLRLLILSFIYVSNKHRLWASQATVRWLPHGMC